MWAIGGGENIWTEADKFYAQKDFLIVQLITSPSCGLTTFGAGKGICPGVTLGLTRLKLFLATCYITLTEQKPEDIDMTEPFGGVNKRKTDLNLIPIPFTPLQTMGSSHKEVMLIITEWCAKKHGKYGSID
ncbi:hypothetical protein GH714_007293 [Hevea brasiliensis]|uniref:Cytochrome P450 n=1 Tax=Hevea brasiliensis TaxID=3981 RepID=A0A6A6MDC9_HEVBR|nr:hypothetical protein GH714_007293 [Hevea brasiliensis]